MTQRIACLASSAILLAACSAESTHDARGGSPAMGMEGGAGDAGGTEDMGDGGGAHETCASASVQANRLTASVSLVIDGSGSMEQDFGGISRWQAVRDALLDPDAGIVPTLEAGVKFGLTVYSGRITSVFRNGEACPDLVEVPAALDNFTAIADAYPRREPGGSTPTGEALMRVVARLPNLDAHPDATAGPRIIVLATDGEPNGCQDISRFISSGFGGGGPATNYEPTRRAAIAARDRGITLYVISLAEKLSNAQELQRVANIGQGLPEDATPGAEVYQPRQPGQLADTLASLVGDVIGCRVVLDGELQVDRACEGRVVLNGEALACHDPDGWKPVDARHIELLGDACRRFRSDPGVVLDASFPCDVVTLL